MRKKTIVTLNILGGLISLALLISTILTANHQSKIDMTYNIINLNANLMTSNFFLTIQEQNMKQDLININLFQEKSLKDIELANKYLDLSNQQTDIIKTNVNLNSQITNDTKNLVQLKQKHKKYEYISWALLIINSAYMVFIIYINVKYAKN